MYTFEDGVFYKPRKHKSPAWGMWVFIVILALLFVYRSTRPMLRLRADPPPSFYDHNANWNKEERQQERRVAQAYWRVAVYRIQTHYGARRPLPADPPPSFRVGDAANTMESGMTASRVHYWHRLREVWHQRDAWVESERWNTDWVEDSVVSLWQNAPHWLSNIFQAVIEWFNTNVPKIPSP